MGRGRSKAKQTKVARKLKYSGAGGDLARLQRELHATRNDRDETEEGASAEPDETLDEP